MEQPVLDFIAKLPQWFILGVTFIVIGTICVSGWRAIHSGGSFELSKLKITGRSVSQAQESMKLSTVSQDPPTDSHSSKILANPKEDRPISKLESRGESIVELIRCKLQMGQPLRLFENKYTVILREIAEKEQKTIYSRAVTEFALIEFRDCGCVNPSVGVYEESLHKYWLPYFTVGDFDSHCVFRVYLSGLSSRGAEATFFWIETINRFGSEVELNVLRLHGSKSKNLESNMAFSEETL